MGHLQKIIGKNVKKSRTEQGLTQQVLAEKADISIPFLPQLESGSRGPSLEVLGKLASALGLAPYQLLVEDEEETATDRRSTISRFSNDLRKELDKAIKQVERRHLSK